MPADLTDQLCTRCGLCCDGSLFADVELVDEAEALPLEVLGLDIDDDGDDVVLVQPCVALDGTRCTVYAHRPACCRAFECALLQRARSGTVSVAQALAQIEDARARIGRVEARIGPPAPDAARLSLAERCAEALDTNGRAEPGLRAAMGEVQRLIRTTFFGLAPSPRRSRPARRSR